MNPVDQILTAGDNTRDEIGVPAKILRPGMHDEINAKFDGTLINRRGESAVDHADEAVLLRQSGGLMQINDSHRGVGRRLQIQNSGVRSYCSLMLLVLDGID